MIFNRETVDGVQREIIPLLHEHYREIAKFQDIPLDVDWLFYRNAERMNLLRIFTCRKNTVLIGYAVFCIKPNPHYASSLQASQDVVFIQKNQRGNGREFIKWCDAQLKSEGVQAVYHHIKAKHNFGPMLEAQGYELVDLIYCKRLDVEAT